MLRRGNVNACIMAELGQLVKSGEKERRCRLRLIAEQEPAPPVVDDSKFQSNSALAAASDQHAAETQE